MTVTSVRTILRRRAPWIGLCAALSIASPQRATAQTPSPAAPSADDATAPAPAPTPGKPAVSFRWTDHPTLLLGDSTEIAFRARLQTHVTDSDASIGDARSFDLSRRRVGVEGRIAGAVDFQVDYEIDDDEPWRDVYANLSAFDAVQVQAGKFKLPFGLDENTSSGMLDFVYRSRAATQLAPGRDVGVMVHGRALKRLIGYEAGVFAHDGGNASSKSTVAGDRTLAARLTLQPLRGKKRRWRDLQVSVAGTTSDVPEGISGLRGRTALDAPFFEPDLWVQGARRRGGVEFRWRPGPFSVKAEYARVTTERREQSVDDTDLSPLVASAWYVSGTYLVTGERKTDGIDAPRRTLLRGGWGALELAARIESLRFGSAATAPGATLSPRTEVIAPNADRVQTFGVNWVPIRGLKLQANLIHETLADPLHGPLPSRPAFWSRVLRFQIAI